MSRVAEFCSWNQVDETVVVVMLQQLGSLDWQHFGELTDEITRCLRNSEAKDIVVDLSRTKIMGSETIGFLIRLRGVAAKRGGNMALFGVSELVLETLEAMRLGEEFWHICTKQCIPSPVQCAECPEFLTAIVRDTSVS